MQAEAAARASADGALAESITTVQTTVGANTAAIQAEAQTRATETGALSTQITTVVANYQAADAATLTSAQGYADTAAAGAAGTALTTAQAAVQAEAAARASADGALAESITTVQTTVGANTAAIQTQATSINGLSAQYTIKVQAGGISGGLGLAAESPDGTDGVIDFAIRANRFHIAPPDGMGDVKTALFTHYATPTTINGVEIPAGTYMDAAFMRTFVAQKGQIGELAVDDAAIANLSAAKLTAGDGTIGNILKSENYLAGETGWAVKKDGTAEFSGVVVRGTVYATDGSFSGQLFAGDALNGISWDGTNFSVRSSQLQVDNGSATFAGALNAATGSFAGALSGATGTFSGVLSAGVLNSAAFDSYQYEYTTAGAFNLTIPPLKAGWSAMKMRITLQGAGGGGAGGVGYGAGNGVPFYESGSWFLLSALSGKQGGSGSRLIYDGVPVTPGQTISINVGAGGAGGTPYNGTASGVHSEANGSSGGATNVVYGATYSVSAGSGATSGYFTKQYQGEVDGSPGILNGDSYYAARGASGADGGRGAGGGGGSALALYHSYHRAIMNCYGGGKGGDGYVLIEFYDPNTIVLNNRYSALVQWLDTIGHGAVPEAAR